jgi:hypothetical protein
MPYDEAFRELSMKSATMLGLLLLAAISVTPAQANWFSSQKTTGSMWNLGSIRNPTPQELRQYYAKIAADRETKAAKTK